MIHIINCKTFNFIKLHNYINDNKNVIIGKNHPNFNCNIFLFIYLDIKKY